MDFKKRKRFIRKIIIIIIINIAPLIGDLRKTTSKPARNYLEVYVRWFSCRQVVENNDFRLSKLFTSCPPRANSFQHCFGLFSRLSVSRTFPRGEGAIGLKPTLPKIKNVHIKMRSRIFRWNSFLNYQLFHLVPINKLNYFSEPWSNLKRY